MLETSKTDIRRSVDAHALDVLEFSRIREHIAEFCGSPMGTEIALAVEPLEDVSFARTRLETIDEISTALAESGQPDLTGLSDVRRAVAMAEKEGFLTPEEIWAVGLVIIISNRLAHYYRKSCKEKPHLESILSAVEEVPGVDRRIAEFILPPGVLDEDATPLLKELRKRRAIVHERLREKLESYLTHKTYSKYLQDELITLKNGRLVLPVKIENKAEIAGVIHDRSSSGATLFIEPLPVVEMNNELRELELAERAERERILRLLSSMIAEYAPALRSNLEIFAWLDFLVACARWAQRNDCTKPIYGEDRDLLLFNARHPLLLEEARGEKGMTVVPLNLELPAERRALIITGPNMGGKTVALKTVGLLSAIARSGLPIPADEGSKIPAFSAIFADIGDEQSIDDSLSSFAAHVMRWKEALLSADDRSLVLIDEIGSATDPEEGTPLSRAILEELIRRKCYLIATTHLGGLKALATASEGVENGAMEFDEIELEPTFILRTGAPGRSWAFQIARRLGLPEEILAKGEELIGDGGSQVDKLISDLKRKTDEAEELRARAKAELSQLESDRETLNALIKSNKEKALQVEELRKRYDDDRLDMLERELAVEKRKLDAELREYRKLQDATESAKQHIRKKIDEVKKRQKERRGPPVDVKAGDAVWLYRLKKHGKVIRETDKHGYILVEVDGMKIRVHSSSALPPKDETFKGKSGRGGVKYRRPNVPSAKDLRGMNFEEAWKVIDEWLSDAVVVRIPRLVVIHGKGTGALRDKIRTALQSDKRVAKWEYAESAEGGDGATIVHIKS
ncbi:MAG TPA: endonuclease MutS2 [candidate division Zixibacteria bacterium]|nr:endonuclease MutS2 [candidate division Zixibacteria bacterium]